jgi:transglutaminase-like putative cysteine protease
MTRRALLVLLLSLGCDRTPLPPEQVESPTTPEVVATDTAPVTANARTLHATMLGRPFGTIELKREPLPGGGEKWTTRTVLTLALDDPGESAKTIETVDVSEYAPGHVFIRGNEESTEDGVRETVATEVRGKELWVKVTGPAHDKEQLVPIPADYSGEMIVFEKLRAEVEAGEKLPRSATFSSFDDDSLVFEPTQMTLLERTQVVVAGKPIEGWKIESLDKTTDERVTAVLDESGMPLRMEVGVFVATAGEPEAPTGDMPKLSSYLSIAGRVPSDPTSLVLKVSVDGDDPKDAPIFKDGPYQKVVRDGNEYTLTLAAVRGDGLAKTSLPLGSVPADVKQFLEPTPMSQSDDKDIVARARAIAGGTTDARTAAVAITQWVHDNLGKKDGTRGAATAVEVLGAGYGDCTEHSALTVAMLRAIGLPARNAGGIVLVPGFFSSDAGYHAWVEVWLGDWVALDPALGRMKVGAHYLLLGYSEPGMASGSAGLSRLIGRTTLAVVD